MVDQKKVTQEELRRLMKEKSSASKTKITSQYAKYNILDQLICSLCGTIMKSEKFWNAHLLSKTHKENLVKAAAPAKLPVKRTHESTSAPSDHKKVKSDNTSTKPSLSHKSILANGTRGDTATEKNIQLANYASSSDDDDEEEVGSDATKQSDLKNNSSAVASLPVGFFDDPKLDAKARNVPYKNKMDEEMEKFQKEIREQIEISEDMNEDNEERIDRTIEDIDENMARWKKLYSIIEKKKPIISKQAEKAESNSDDDEDDDADITGQTWRGK